MLKSNYNELYELSLSQPDKFWHEIAQEVSWHKPYKTVIESAKKNIPDWFVGGEINMSYNCLDKAVEEGFGDDVAVVHESPVTDTIEKITYKELLKSVELFAGLLVQKCDVKKGDRVLFYLPVIPQCMIGMLACCRIGAIYTVVFHGLPTHQLATRIKHVEPKVVVTCNVGYNADIELNFKDKIEMAIKESEFNPKQMIIYNRPQSKPAIIIKGRDLDWMKEISNCSPQFAIPVESNHPIFIIYTSGTTGEPKGLVMVTGNLIVFSKFNMKYLFNNKARECSWMFSNFGWITGHIQLTYGPLLTRGITILYEGNPTNTPDPGQILRILNRNKVVSFMASPTVFRILRKDCSQIHLQLNYSGLRGLFMGGELSDASLRDWLTITFKCPVYDIWGQTELGGPITSPCLGFGRPVGSYPVFIPGFRCKIIDSLSGKECKAGTIGEITLEKLLSPSLAITIYKNHDRFIKSYFTKYPGHYDTNDYGRILPNGQLEILGRSDDIIEVGSTNFCGGEIECVCLNNDDLINVAIVPLNDVIYGNVPFGFLIKRNDHKHNDEEIINETIELVKRNIGELAFFNKMVIVPDLPKTLTHKISRQSLSEMINEKEYKVPATVYNPEIYKDLYDILIKNNYKAKLPMDL